MRHEIANELYEDRYEYQGGTLIEHVRLREGRILWREWLEFESIEEAEEVFHLELA